MSFGTGQGVRQRSEVLQFRTPQHPSLGTNNWGGASPLLARDIPKESLDQRYARLNTVRDGDHIFSVTTIEDEIFKSPATATTIREEIFSDDYSAAYYTATPRRRGLFRKAMKLPRKLRWLSRKRSLTLGSNKLRFGCFPRLDPKKKWPNGWC